VPRARDKIRTRVRLHARTRDSNLTGKQRRHRIPTGPPPFPSIAVRRSSYPPRPY
jgi:hypothetical protein